jgi:DNA-binding NtrC family response regulator
MTHTRTIRILVVGRASKMGLFLEALRALPSVEVAGILDSWPDSQGLALARRLKLPVYACQQDCSELSSLHALAVFDARAMSMLDRGSLPESMPVFHGHGLRLLRRLAGAFKKSIVYRDTYQTVKHTYGKWLHTAEDLVGKSEQIEEVKQLVRKVAPTPTPVLLLGETGTGKDLVARAIHHHSLIKDKPFIAVNCTALTGTLMESELFGYRKGAFTGADEDRKGLLEEADNGTLFLDEIGDMPLELQSKLLRFLQTGEVRRVGSTKTKVVRVRVIAATNRDMEQATAENSFRRDLYYRFNTFTIRLCPLSERRVDIPYLAYHFLTKAEAKLNKKMEGIDDAAMACLVRYAWPGNVRELSNVMERAVILCQNGVIQPVDLPQQINMLLAAVLSNPAISCQEDDCLSGFSSSKSRIMANFERKELERYLKNAQGNVSEACRLSGVPRRTFYRKMRKYGL